MLQRQADSRQIPKVKTYTASKKYNDLLYGVLQEMSELADECGVKVRYVMEKDISYSQLGTRLGLTRQTVSTKFKNLISLGLIVEDTERKRYVLKQLDQTSGSLIPFKTLKVLNNTLSHNAISTYVYLLNRFIAAGETPYVVTLKQVKEFIGIAASTSSNDEIVTDIFQVLKLIGLIDYGKIFDEEYKSYFTVKTVRNMIKEC